MKLISRFVLVYLIVTMIVLGIAGVISYFIIMDEINKELVWRFMDRIERVTYLLEKGKEFDSRRIRSRDDNLVVRELDYRHEPSVEVKDTLVWHEGLQRMEPNLKVSAYRDVNDTTYYISTYGALIESDDITEAVVKILLWILGLQVIGAVGVGFIVSGRLFKPFRETLERIRNFKLRDKRPISAEKTNIREFDDLNLFVEEMTRKAVADYKNLKEFAENASHELQTPLAIAQGKLELLTETDLSPEQYRYVEATQRTIRKLSRLSESLALLTKIENHEFTDSSDVNMTELVEDSIRTFEEFIKLNGLKVKADLEKDIVIRMHPMLADFLWTSLFQNAIKHNIERGCIEITLTGSVLRVANTGKQLTVPPEMLFERFKKADQNSDSIGLGLSIIKRITDQNNFRVSYCYQEGWHIIEVHF
jgi:signal transduction histidine kinase